MPNQRKQVAVLFGGRSVEHEISIISALQLIEALDSSRYTPVPVYVAMDGAWHTGGALTDRSFYRRLPDALAEVERAVLLPVPGIGGLARLERKGGWLRSRRRDVIPIDVYFPVFHGTYGEDGCVQGLFELADVTYCGCGVLASALGMDKFLTKCVAESQGIPVLPGRLVVKREVASGLAQISRRLNAELELPLFVKPCSLGSSVGIGRADDDRQLDAALLKVFEVDEYALVEPCVRQPLEINVAVLGSEPARTSVVEVPIVEGGGVLGYEEKYLRQQGAKGSSLAAGMAGTARVIDPVDLPEEIKAAVREHAARIFELLRCAGVARVDFIFDPEAKKLYFNEINTLPGSLAYYLWAQSKPPLLFTELLNAIIEQAESQKERARALRRDFGFRSLSRQT